MKFFEKKIDFRLHTISLQSDKQWLQVWRKMNFIQTSDLEIHGPILLFSLFYYNGVLHHFWYSMRWNFLNYNTFTNTNQPPTDQAVYERIKVVWANWYRKPAKTLQTGLSKLFNNLFPRYLLCVIKWSINYFLFIEIKQTNEQNLPRWKLELVRVSN